MPKSPLTHTHRAYRKLAEVSKRHLFGCIGLTLGASMLMLSIYSKLFHWMHEMAYALLMQTCGRECVAYSTVSCLWTPIDIISVAKTPSSPWICLGVTLFSILFIAALTKIRMIKALSLWLMLLALILSISGIYFALIPNRFCYSIQNFNEFYFQAQILTWLVLPIFLTMALTAVPTPLISKIAFVLGALVYSILFGVCRYVLFVYLLAKVSLLFMPLLFLGCPLLDTFTIVGLYALYMSFAQLKSRSVECS